MAQEYGNSSIRKLKGSDSVRKKPEVFLTHRDIRGARHTIIEMVGNGIDEKQAGFGESIDITYYPDFSVSVRDYGRGVPLGWNEVEQQYNWELIYYEMFAGGKYDEDIDIEHVDMSDIDTVNKLFHIGTNGLGGFATQGSSEFFEVRSYHNKEYGNPNTPMVCSMMRFEKGVPVYEELQVSPTEEKRGTFVHWKPDREVFTDMTVQDLDFNWIKSNFVGMAYSVGCSFFIRNEATGEEVVVKGSSIQEYLTKCVGKHGVEDKVYSESALRKGNSTYGDKIQWWIAKCNIEFAFVDKAIPLKCFHNSVPLERGATFDGFNGAVTVFFKELEKQKGVKFQPVDYKDCLTAVISTYSTSASYEGQTKYGVSNDFLYNIVYELVYNRLRLEMAKNNKVLTKMIEKAVESALVREEIKKIEKQQKEAKKAVGKKREKADKISECETNNPEDAELWIAEGDSAKGALTNARDSRYQAVIPIIGKIINSEKASLDKLINNGVVQNIFRALGCYMDLPNSNLFKLEDVKYHKIIFGTDADEDGFQIRVLLFLLFYRLAPRILEEGYLYISEPPLFDNILTNNTHVYKYTQAEQAEFLEANKGRVSETKRYKGLGEMNADVLWETTMNPSTRKLTQIKFKKDDENCSELIDCMFGRDKFKLRKQILADLVGAQIESILTTVDSSEFDEYRAEE